MLDYFKENRVFLEPSSKYTEELFDKIEEVVRNQDLEDNSYLKRMLDEEQIEIPVPSEKVFHEQGYDKGEYCHKQSFLWGFQEGYDYAVEEFLKLLKTNWTLYLTKDVDGEVHFDGYEKDFKDHMIKKQCGEI